MLQIQDTVQISLYIKIITFEGTYITPFGVSNISCFKSSRTFESGEYELTPSVSDFEGLTFPRHVEKQRLYAIIIDG